MHDRYALTLDAARALREGDFVRIDQAAVAEELERVANADVHELRSRVAQILEHLLKLRLATGLIHEYNQRGWMGSVLRQQAEIGWLLQESPSLRRLLTAEFLDHCYKTAAVLVAQELDVTPDEHCPFTLTDILPDR